MPRQPFRRVAAVMMGAMLAGGAITDTITEAGTGAAGALGPVLAVVPGSPDILRADVARRVAAVTSPVVSSQFTTAEVTANVLDELIGLDLDRAVAAGLGVIPDVRAAQVMATAGATAAGSPAAYQQELIRDPGLGWAGVDVYTLDTVLRRQLASAEATRLTPVPLTELQAEYAAQLGSYQHAHVQIITTPDHAVAERDAALARADPARFPTLARADTDDDTHRAAGGDYGPSLARGQLYATVDDAIFAAAPNAILGPITVAQARPEYYVIHVLSVVDIPLSAVTPALTARALAPAGPYVLGSLASARQRFAAGVTVAGDAGTFDAGSLSVVPPDVTVGAAPG